MDRKSFKKPRGTRDILPDESLKWLFLEARIREVFARHNFHEIRTPTFEDTELFSRGIGQTTDIVQKEMYTFKDNGGKHLTLRPELTASVMRAYQEHHLGEKRAVQKLYYLATMFRQERPQAGRFREFNQYGVELIGSQSAVADAEAIALAVEIPTRLGVTGLSLKINSVGCKNCRPGYKKALQEALKDKYDDLCDDCKKRYKLNPLRLLDCKKKTCRSLTEEVPSILDFLCEECLSHFQSLRQLLEAGKFQYEFDKRLVRGLDYYTKTAFEVISDQLGSQDAICGGGRYDYLAEEIGGKAVPAVGFAAGVERLLAVLEALKKIPPMSQQTDLYIAAIGPDAIAPVFSLAQQMRRKGIICEIDYLNRSLKAQLRDANRLNTRFVAMIGDEELKSNAVLLKDMTKGEQQSLSIDQLADFVSHAS